ncbi:hypothetical protein INT43_002438 [Umbelopsis isabellina]|uniref:Uncharacterized protein n=1 Tax=Mortierella isabellina TaxID=91625 RepID=A0A8H7Q635_MORIS|nr:hypothetical protein INT43_002438 [Umbelopsis isabellina]
MPPLSENGEIPKNKENEETTAIEVQANGHSTNAVDSAASPESLVQHSSPEQTNPSGKRHGESVQSVKERIINTSKLLRILEKQRAGMMPAKNQSTNETVNELKEKMNLLMKEKEIASKQIINQSMELEKLRKVYEQQIHKYDEVKSDLDQVSKEVSQAVLDKERAESAKRSFEMLCEQLKAQIAEYGQIGIPSDEKLKKEMMKIKSLADQYKSQYQSSNIAWKAEELAHNATLANLNGVQRSLSHVENMLELQRKENDNLKLANDKLNEQLIEVNINHQMELEQAQTNLEDAQDKLREYQRLSKLEAQKYIKENVDSTASTKSGNEKKLESVKLELEQVKMALKNQSECHKELQNQAKIEHDALKEMYEKLFTETEKDKNLKAADSDSNTQLLEKRITELQAQLAKEQAHKATQSAVSGSQNTQYTALKADYELAIRENKNLKRAKEVLQDKTTDFMVRIDDLERQLRGATQQVVTTGLEISREKELSPASERRVSELKVTSPSTNTERGVSAKSHKSAEPPKEPTKGRKTATASNNMEVPSPASRKRKSVVGDEDTVIEQPKPATKRGRKKATEVEKEYIVPVTDYSKLIMETLQTVLSTSPEDIIPLFEPTKIYTTLKTDLLLHALDSVCTTFDTPEVSVHDGMLFEDDFGVADWLVVTMPDNIDEREQRLIWFLFGLCSLNPTTQFFDRICVWMRNLMLSCVVSNPKKACCISRMFINICKAAGDISRARTFCYDLLRELPPTHHIVFIMGNFAQSWSRPLRLEDSAKTTLPADNLITRSMQSIVKKLATDHNDNQQIQNSLYYLQKNCNWKPENEVPDVVDFLDDISNAIVHPQYSTLRQNDMTHSQTQHFNVIKATELVYYHHGDWEFTYQVFISTVVYPLLQNSNYIDFALELIGSLGRKGLYDETDEKSGLAGLRSEMTKALNVNIALSSDEFGHQVFAATALLNLANGKAILARPLIKWHRELTPENKASLPSGLSDAIRAISKEHLLG